MFWQLRMITYKNLEDENERILNEINQFRKKNKNWKL